MQKHHHHDHFDPAQEHHHEASSSALLWPLLLTLGFAFVEAIGGWVSGSLALIGDAGHMFSDCAALGLAWFASWIARKPASDRHSFGLIRAEVMVALVNSIAMLILVGVIVFEAIQRMQNPAQVHGLEVMVIAVIGLIVNIFVARHLHQHIAHDHAHGNGNINSRAAFLHVLGDLLGSAAAILSGAVIYFTGWFPIDAILSLLIASLILVSTIRLLREALHVLMEGVPLEINLEQVQALMLKTGHVTGVHQLHVWALSSNLKALSAHVVLDDIHHWQHVLIDLKHALHEHFDIAHVTLQPELVGEAETLTEPECWLTASHQHHH